MQRAVPGLLLCLTLMAIARPIAAVLGGVLLRIQGVDPEGRASPVSAVVVAVLLGLLIGNTLKLPPTLKPGLDFATKKILRLGIVLVGIKLSLLSVLKLGLFGVPVVVTLILAAFGFTTLLGRLLGLSPRLALLTAAGTGICGITATLATAPVLKANEQEVALTVANVTLFGTIGMLFFPTLAHALFADQPAAAGLFLGTSVHDTSQVIGAALAYRDVYNAPLTFDVATVTKLTRNVFLAVVVPALGFFSARGEAVKPKWGELIPMFVLFFLAMALLRTVGDWGLEGGGRALFTLDAAQWKSLTTLLGEDLSTAALGTALAGVGLGIRLSTFRGIGLKPIYLGAGAAMFVALTGMILATLVGPHIG